MDRIAIKNVRDCISNKELPFKVDVKDVRGVIGLEVNMRTRYGMVHVVRQLFRVPSDLVIMDGLSPALDRLITDVNLCMQCGDVCVQ